jgi:hypothetical protein
MCTGPVRLAAKGRLAYKILVEKLERKSPLGRCVRIREDNINIYL